jgi:squalene synthase HpnC
VVWPIPDQGRFRFGSLLGLRVSMGSFLTASDLPSRALPDSDASAPPAAGPGEELGTALGTASGGSALGSPVGSLPDSLRRPVIPTIALAFAPPTTLEAARAATWRLAHGHYENFPVVTVMVPARLRQDFCNVYAFCRIADDLGDEVDDPVESLRLLDRFRGEVELLYAGQPRSLVFTALADTVERHQIPRQPFLDLIDAFEQDQRVSRYDTVEQLLGYCHRSADPVGRLVLYLCGCGDERRQRLSDCTCTALQLINFWQDVRRDLVDRNRIYLPRQTMDAAGLSEADILRGIGQGRCTETFRVALKTEVDRADQLFAAGDALLPLVPDWCRAQIGLFSQGGRAIVTAVRRQNYDTLAARPSISRWQKGRLVLWALVNRLAQAASANHTGGEPAPASADEPALAGVPSAAGQGWAREDLP